MGFRDYVRGEVDEDYIDMDICHSPFSGLVREFEFQMGSSLEDNVTATFPADELFYKGKLLPLHLPPRLRMVQALIENGSARDKEVCIASSTPQTSCSISPSESCRASCEMNPEEYLFEWSTEIESFATKNAKNLLNHKLTKPSIREKLKASTSYIKSFFSAPRDSASGSKPASKTCSTSCEGNRFRHTKLRKSLLQSQIEKIRGGKEMAEEGYISQRRSFSGVMNWNSHWKSVCSSSSSSSSRSSYSSSSSLGANGFYDVHYSKRRSSASSELECSVQEAIAHCKMSLQQFIIPK